MSREPLSGWREGTARKRRTKTDWAREVADLPEGRYADYRKASLVPNNLNTHTKGAFHAAFEPESGRESWCVGSSSATRRSTAAG